jgi:galactofuranosylgalactofuranosylrhamnosyl-N-acetylglucosaminyl-diphospho-decaprenol beta-1,5/1,6-galactofuranosyltransferase
MHIVSRIQLPKSADVSALYIQSNEGATINYQEGATEVVLKQGGIVSSNSYFNSFYEKFYAKYTSLSSVYYLLNLEGNFQVSIYREGFEENTRNLIFEEKFDKCQLSDSIKISLPKLVENEQAGRIYFEILCLSEQGLFKEGAIATEQNKPREVALGIITCTFKKEEYIKNTLNTILSDDSLRDKSFKVFVVDNGKTLEEEDFKSQKIQLITNRNVGGSGGFTRGLMEALQANIYSHFLFMDDDIELNSEAIYRLFSLYEYAKFDFAVAGSMLDLYEKHILAESGAVFGKNPNTMKFAPFMGVPLKRNLDLQNATSLNQLLLEEDIDYGGFWFFASPKKFIEDIGLLMPLFIYLDDQDFGLRIKEHFGDKIVAFPSIAVWHEPSYAAKKINTWSSYYFYRNHLITHAIHQPLTHTTAVKELTKALSFYLLYFEYNTVEMIIEAFEDYLKGPDFIKNNDPEVLHSHILKLSQSHKTQKVQQNELPLSSFEQPTKSGNLQKIISLLTLNGQLLPNFLTSDDDVFVMQGSSYPNQRPKAFGKKKVFISQEGTTFLFQNERDKSVGIKLLTRWFKVAIKSSIKWSAIGREWKKASREMLSTRFWQQYLGLS